MRQGVSISAGLAAKAQGAACVVFFLCWAACLLVCATQAPGGVSSAFDPYRPLTLHLQMDVEDWDRVRFDQPQQSESWVPEVAQAWMWGEGEEPIRVAVRRKGESDIPLPSEEDPRKVSLKIDVNQYVSGQQWRGLKKLSLENGSSAPLREGFAWIIHRQAAPLYGYPAAFSGWVRLFINGEEAGLFTNAEQRDETFLRNHDLYSPTCTWLYKVDAGTFLEVGVSNSPAYNNLQFAPFVTNPGGGKKPPSNPPPDFDVYLPQWINMRGMLTLAACHAFTENTDSLFTHDGKNTFCVDFYPPYPRTRRYYPWDQDTGFRQGVSSIYGTTTYQTSILDHAWFGRVYEHILRELLDGPLSTEALTNVLNRMEAGLSDAALSDPYVYADGGAAEFASLRSWVATRNANIRSQFRHAFVPRPVFSHPDGEVAPGFALDVSASAGTVYYTLDGTDPRASGGSPSVSARAWEGPLAVESHMHVVARALSGADWSGLAAEATFSLASHGSALRVTEIMYNPLDVNLADSRDNDAYEFIEFRNTGAVPLDLSSFYCEGITFTFPPGFTVAAGDFIVLVRDPAAFAERYSAVAYHGVYLGKLDNGGEKIRVRRPDGTTVLSVEYDDDPPWVLGPDGMGYSLVNTDTDANPDDPAVWRASAALFGSPGAEDPAPAYHTGVVINELLSHTDPPLEDAVEFHNPAAVPADIGGWFLSDAARDVSGNLDPVRLKKYRIPDGTVIAPGGFAVVYEQAFNGASAVSPFALSEFGEKVYLSAADAAGNLLGHIIAVDFPALENGVSFGRVMTSTGPQYAALAARTFGTDTPANLSQFRTGTGAANASARVGPVVISEIMYNPSSTLTEFIELHNVSAAPVDISGWKVNGAGGFVFPGGTILGAGGFALLVDTSRITVEAFRLERDVPAGCLVFGGVFMLDNDGERLTLQKPNTSPFDPLFTVESVRYNDKAPWPTEADGGGPSLERYDPEAYGNDPLNWRTSRAGGSPGRTNLFDAGLAVVPGSRWKYRAAGTSLGTAWREPDYADTVWPDAHGPLGYGEEGLATVIPYGPDPDNRPVTTYFRKAFTVPEDPATFGSLTLAAQYDDGFVAYLNGVEVARRSMPDGEPSFDTLADDHESGLYESISLDEAIPLLRQGRNVLAVEVHQSSPSSQDLFWDARLTYASGATPAAAVPGATPPGKLFIDPLAVALDSATPDAVIRYTLDGTTPDEASEAYVAPLDISASTVLKARAYALGYTPSGVATHFYERIEEDGDEDGLPDAWERLHFGDTASVSGGGDADNDGVSNHDEYICGTDPNDARSAPTLLIESEAGVLRVRFLTVASAPDSLAYRGQSRYYSLQSAPALTGPEASWAAVPGFEAIGGDGAAVAHPLPQPAAGGFFKLRVWLAP